MGIFIEAETEPYADTRESLRNETNEAATRAGPEGAAGVRRPVRGYQLKERSFATIRILGRGNEFFNVIDAAGEYYEIEEGRRRTQRYSNFFVNSVTEERHEKVQVIDNFGDPILLLFGEAPRSVNVSGALLNTADFNWRNEFWENYDKYFRGTRLVELGARLYLIYDDRIFEGLILKAQAQETANTREYLPFSFQMFITGYTPISLVGDPNFPVPNDGTDYTQDSVYEQGLRAWEQSRRLQSDAAQQKLLLLNKAAYARETITGDLADLVRGGILDAGDPSIASFLSRASSALGGRESANDVQSLFGGDRGGNASSQGRRTIPLREEIIHNVDEFIGGVPQGIDQSVIDSLPKIEQWSFADASIDEQIEMIANTATALSPNLTSATLPFDPSDTQYFDMMGRAGRADQEVRSKGGRRKRTLSSGRTKPNTRSESFRDVPFGIVAADGEFPSGG